MSKQREVEGFELEEQIRLSCSPSLSSPQHSIDQPAAAALTAAFTPLYYVQSPHSTLSHAHTHTTHQAETPLLSPITSTSTATATTMIVATNHRHRHHAINDSNHFSIALPPEQSAGSDLSRYSSSRGSSSSFLRAKTNYVFSKLENGLRNVGGGDSTGHGGGDDDEPDNSTHCLCSVMKMAWKALVSFLAAMLVFFLVTRPPIPQLNVKEVMVREFKLAEGVDRSGVPTKMLRFNCSIDLELDNKSRVFGVHLHKATLQLAFQNLNLAISHGGEMYVEKNTLLSFRLFVGAKDKGMYAAGETMDAMLESGIGLPLVLRLSLKSHIAIPWSIMVKPSGFTHHAYCSVFLIDHKHHVLLHPKQDQNVTCTTHSH